MPSVGTPTSLPRTTANTAIVINGCSTTHTTPSSVWRYRTFTSRQTGNQNSSRNAQSSARPSSGNHPIGRITIVVRGGAFAMDDMDERGAVSGPLHFRNVVLVVFAAVVLRVVIRMPLEVDAVEHGADHARARGRELIDRRPRRVAVGHFGRHDEHHTRHHVRD